MTLRLDCSNTGLACSSVSLQETDLSLCNASTMSCCFLAPRCCNDDELLFSCRSPSGMIESTPQLFGNAWRISSACSASLTPSQLDPCDTHQQAGQFLFLLDWMWMNSQKRKLTLLYFMSHVNTKPVTFTLVIILNLLLVLTAKKKSVLHLFLPHWRLVTCPLELRVVAIVPSVQRNILLAVSLADKKNHPNHEHIYW